MGLRPVGRGGCSVRIRGGENRASLPAQEKVWLREHKGRGEAFVDTIAGEWIISERKREG